MSAHAAFEPNISYRINTLHGPGPLVHGFQVGVFAVSCRAQRVTGDPAMERQGPRTSIEFHNGWHVDHWPTGYQARQCIDLASALIFADDISLICGDATTVDQVVAAIRAARAGAWIDTVTATTRAEPYRAWRAAQSGARP